jgi:hypothetical protein
LMADPIMPTTPNPERLNTRPETERSDNSGTPGQGGPALKHATTTSSIRTTADAHTRGHQLDPGSGRRRQR